MKVEVSRKIKTDIGSSPFDKDLFDDAEDLFGDEPFPFASDNSFASKSKSQRSERSKQEPEAKSIQEFFDSGSSPFAKDSAHEPDADETVFGFFSGA
jgi:hypothetical protein